MRKTIKRVFKYKLARVIINLGVLFILVLALLAYLMYFA